jgi:hypothetical protein
MIQFAWRAAVLRVATPAFSAREVAMGWFGRKKRGTVSAAGGTAIRVFEPDGRETVIDVAGLDWLSFLQVGDESTVVYEGWWLLGSRDGAIAILIDCGAIDPLLRDCRLAEVAERIDDKTLVFTDSRPLKLRGRDAQDGIVHLDSDEGTHLRRSGTQERVRSVREFPRII